MRETSLNDPRSSFNFLTRSSETDTREFGSSVWREINLANLRENIAPSRERAHLVLEKGSDHGVDRVRGDGQQPAQMNMNPALMAQMMAMQQGGNPAAMNNMNPAMIAQMQQMQPR